MLNCYDLKIGELKMKYILCSPSNHKEKSITHTQKVKRKKIKENQYKSQ
jgi:hypothetical protein